MGSFCWDFATAYDVVNGTGLAYFLLGVLEALVFLVLVVYQAVERRRMQRQFNPYEERSNNASLLTPAHVYILLFFGVAMLALGLPNLFFHVPPVPAPDPNVAYVVVFSLGWGFYHAVLDGLAVFLALPGSGTAALTQASAWAAGFGMLAAVVHGTAFTAHLWAPGRNLDYGNALLLSYELALLLFYLALFFLPYTLVNRRPACVFYAGCWTVYRPVIIVALILQMKGISAGTCVYLFGSWLVFGLLKPCCVYWTLRRDSNYWMGIVEDSFPFHGHLKRRPSEADIRTPLLGTSFDPPAAQALAEEMDKLGSSCPLLSFAALTIGQGSGVGMHERAVIGAGGTARVYRGLYRGRSVAIKMVYCLCLTASTVANFFRESALLSGLRHPNIVHVWGVCVVPPCICLVMELCRGNLFEFLRLQSAETLSWGTRLNMAVDCAAGVAALHEHKPPILHMDLKSSNFLIATQTISDWDVRDVQQWLRTCGLHDFLSAFRRGKINGIALLALHSEADLARLVGPKLADTDNFDVLVTKIEEIQDTFERSKSYRGMIKVADLELSTTNESVEKDSDLPSVPQTGNWTAPEVIQFGKPKYTAAADVYALGMVLWEILTGEVPFYQPDIGPSDVNRLVLRGDRPPIPPDTAPEYAALLQDPDARPSASYVRNELMLMRRRWDANQTLDTGTLMVDTAQSIDANEQSFEDVRFAPPDAPRSRLSSASGHSMGSLSNPGPLSDLRKAAAAAVAAKKFLGKRRGRGRRGHARTKSDGAVRLEDLQPLLGTEGRSRERSMARSTAHLAPSGIGGDDDDDDDDDDGFLGGSRYRFSGRRSALASSSDSQGLAASREALDSSSQEELDIQPAPSMPTYVHRDDLEERYC